VLLQNKTAVVYGAAGAIGSSVARAYARAGAEVHLAGRTTATLEEVARAIRTAGGVAHAAQLDVLDKAAVGRHATQIVDTSGGIDVCFNATSNDDIQGRSLLGMSVEEFLQPVIKALTAHITLTTALAPHMARRGGGVMLVMGGGREAIPRLGGSHVAWAALAGLCRQLAADLGPQGIRVVWLLSPGSPGPGDGAGPGEHAGHASHDAPTGAHGLIPRHQPSLAEVSDMATFLASDSARTITASEINLTGGVVID
jgi:NAD(P)-dependent dehydrogenase (short-subunit alcohol dehydrogenase family)